MSVSHPTDDRGSSQDRRAPRVPFEALVEIAAAEGGSFEAESVDLSASGMHLRTAFLPKIGAPLTFRFDAGPDSGGAPVLANGEVVWAHEGAEGSEFGVRFADMKAAGIEAIQRLLGGDDASGEGPRRGAPVRIHIDGITAPMRATLKDELRKGAVVGSDLKMLRIGALVELEDKEKHTRRTARVEGVDCEVDQDTMIPQLVVKLRYDAGMLEGAKAVPAQKTLAGVQPTTLGEAARETTSAESSASSAEPDDDKHGAQARTTLPVGDDGDNRMHALRENVGAGLHKVGTTMKGALSGMGSAASRFGARAKTTISLLAKKGSAHDEGATDTEARRTTSPLPGLAKGRTLRPQGASLDSIRGDEENAMEEIDPKKTARRKQIAVAAGVAVAFVLAFLAFHKPTPKTTLTLAPATELMPPAPSASALAAASAPATVAATDVAPAPSASALAAAAPLQGEPTGSDAKGNPNPFGSTGVKHGTRMVLRLDGPIGELRGLALPNGFVVSVPNRKSLEAAGPLAAKDPRISSAKVVNQASGAELTIAFKDGTPEYVVKVKNDTLEIVLAHDKAVAKKGKGNHAAKHAAKKAK